MTPADQEFIALWNAGTETAAIAHQLGLKVTTAQSRAYRLQQQGLIQPRPRGGAYPTQRAQARPEGPPPPVQRPVQSGAGTPTGHGAETVHDGAVQAPMHGAVQVHSSAEPPIPAAMAAEFERLWAAIAALRQDMHRPVQTTVQSLPEPLFDDPTDNATERWNLYLKHGLRVRVEALAQARGVAPSRVVQEILWQALSDRP